MYISTSHLLQISTFHKYASPRARWHRCGRAPPAWGRRTARTPRLEIVWVTVILYLASVLWIMIWFVLLVIYIDTSDDDDGVGSVMFAGVRSLHDIYTSVLMVFDVTIHCKNLMHAKTNIQLIWRKHLTSLWLKKCLQQSRYLIIIIPHCH